MATIKATQKIKGTDQVKVSVEITSATENYQELIKLAEKHTDLKLAIWLAVNSEARNRTIARAGSLERAKQPAIKSIDFVEVMTTYLKKITAASMCAKLENKILAIGRDMQEAVMAGNFDDAKQFAEDMAQVEVDLQGWQDKRETERATKAASREANKS